MLHIDIGIDLGSAMKPFILRGTILPHEYQMKLSPMNEQNELEISFYEGARALVKDNHYLGAILLTNDKNIGVFILNIEINIHLDMVVSIDNTILGQYKCMNKYDSIIMLNDSIKYIEDDLLLVEREHQRQIYKEYIYQTMYTINNLKEEKLDLLNKLYDAETVAYMEVTTQEFILAQYEIETIVNKYMNELVIKRGGTIV